MPDPCDLLLLAAHPLEFSGFVSELGEQLEGTWAGYRVQCAGVGVGLVTAGAGTVAALAARPCRAALLVGSYGYYPQFVDEPLTLCVPDAAQLLDGALLDGTAALPDVVDTRAVFDGSLVAGLRSVEPTLAGGTIATTLGITTAGPLAERLGRAGLRGENLEALAVAQACASAGVRLAGVFGATNRVGPTGRAEWLQHHRGVSGRTSAFLRRFLLAGAPGL